MAPSLGLERLVEVSFNDVEVWHYSLCAVAALNVVWWVSLAWAHRDEPMRIRMLKLALVYVLVCALRSVLPAIYVERVTWTGGWLNAVILHRCLSVVSELCGPLCAMLYATVLRVSASASDGPFNVASRRAAAASLLAAAVAECFDVYSTATTNNYWSAVVSYLWALNALLSCVAGVCLYVSLNNACHRNGVGFAVVLAVFAAGYCTYELAVDAPMYVERWRADEAAGKVYFTFTEGVADGWSTRRVSRSWEVWRDDASWMVYYFGPSVWAALLLAVRGPCMDESPSRRNSAERAEAGALASPLLAERRGRSPSSHL